MSLPPWAALAAVLSGFISAAQGAPVVTTARNPGDGHFHFEGVPAPRRNDAAATATFTLLDGERDGNGGTLDRLHDGHLPDEADQPGANFFLTQGNKGGRLRVDLGREIAVAEVTSYSWHPGTRGPQVYRLYGSDGRAPDFEAAPKRPSDPAAVGWKLLGTVDTRPHDGASPGGQYGARVFDPAGALGRFRYLLFDLAPTEEADPFGNTFYSEIDVIDQAGPPAEEAVSIAPEVLAYQTSDGRCSFTVNLGDAPEFKGWVQSDLAPAIEKWYPLIVDLLPSEGYTAPKKFTVRFTDEYQGVAVTMGTRIEGSPPWYRKNLKGEGVGSIVHELVHVVQQYNGKRGANRPGWLVEGIPDYVRWYYFEPQSHGADIPPSRAARVKYSDSYRVSANFLHWVTEKYDHGLVPKLNAALREGRYDEVIWKTETGHTLEELGEEWKEALFAARAS